MQALGSVSFKVEGCTDEAARRVVSETVNWSSRPLTWPCLWTLNVAHQTSMPARTHARTTEDVNLVQLDAASRRPARLRAGTVRSRRKVLDPETTAASVDARAAKLPSLFCTPGGGDGVHQR
ncbi:hypothetical protein MANI_018733 [Metarhizium anisopliae]